MICPILVQITRVEKIALFDATVGKSGILMFVCFGFVNMFTQVTESGV